MRIRLICVGKLSNPHWRALAEDYAGRLAKLNPFELAELKDGKAADPEARLREEAGRILELIQENPESALLDEAGQAWSTRELTRWLDDLRGRSVKRLDLVIGSSHGVHGDVKARIRRHLALGPMTLGHEMARVICLEQLYRACTISKGLPYHH